jgi:hypothetical protein
VECNHTCAVAQIRQQGGHIAAAAEDLRVSTNQLEVEIGQQIIGSVAAARTNDRLDLGSRKHFVELVESAACAACEIQIAIENGRKIERLKAFAHQPCAASF